MWILWLFLERIFQVELLVGFCFILWAFFPQLQGTFIQNFTVFLFFPGPG